MGAVTDELGGGIGGGHAGVFEELDWVGSHVYTIIWPNYRRRSIEYRCLSLEKCISLVPRQMTNSVVDF